jgi:hypothetical protein
LGRYCHNDDTHSKLDQAIDVSTGTKQNWMNSWREISIRNELSFAFFHADSMQMAPRLVRAGNLAHKTQNKNTESE